MRGFCFCARHEAAVELLYIAKRQREAKSRREWDAGALQTFVGRAVHILQHDRAHPSKSPDIKRLQACLLDTATSEGARIIAAMRPGRDDLDGVAAILCSMVEDAPALLSKLPAKEVSGMQQLGARIRRAVETRKHIEERLAAQKAKEGELRVGCPAVSLTLLKARVARELAQEQAKARVALAHVRMACAHAAFTPPVAAVASVEALAAPASSGDDHQCVVCMASPREYLLYPCMHRCLCESCALMRHWSECPICRIPPEQVMRVFG